MDRRFPRSRRAEAAVAVPLAALLLLAVAGPAAANPDPAAVQEQLNRAAAEYDKLQADLARTEGRMKKLEADLAAADGVIAVKSAAMRQRAGFLYKSRGSGTFLEGLLTAPDLRVFLKRLQLLGALQDKDARTVEDIRMMKIRAADIREDLERTKARKRQILGALRGKQRQLELRLKTAQTATKVARFGTFEGFVLPVLGGVAFSDSWGDPRSGGRRHQGTDLMAPCGAKVVAVTNGRIQEMHSGGNGGIMLWLRAANGDVFFYAHLQKYAEGAHQGRQVAMGELIAYNGNSGNARGGPCHVHFEWHPRGGRAVNPYRLLRAALG